MGSEPGILRRMGSGIDKNSTQQAAIFSEGIEGYVFYPASFLAFSSPPESRDSRACGAREHSAWHEDT